MSLLERLLPSFLETHGIPCFIFSFFVELLSDSLRTPSSMCSESASTKLQKQRGVVEEASPLSQIFHTAIHVSTRPAAAWRRWIVALRSTSVRRTDQILPDFIRFNLAEFDKRFRAKNAFLEESERGIRGSRRRGCKRRRLPG